MKVRLKPNALYAYGVHVRSFNSMKVRLKRERTSYERKQNDVSIP